MQISQKYKTTIITIMKIPTTEQIRQCEAYTMEHKPVSALELMETAATACANYIKQRFTPNVSIAFLCGRGNNGGDGLAMARLLTESGFNCTIYLVTSQDVYSAECQHQLNLLKERDIDVTVITPSVELPRLDVYDIIVDALFGTGLNKVVEEPFFAKIITVLNQVNTFVFAVDTPSGLLSEQMMEKPYTAVKADFTLTFQFPKLSFFFAENYYFTGDWAVADIGLDCEYISHLQSIYNWLDYAAIKSFVRQRRRIVHKGTFGHGLLIAGSVGMMGAAVLSAKAALRTGIGLLTTVVPQRGCDIMQNAVHEAICRFDRRGKLHFMGVPPESLKRYTAIGVGCGLGTHLETAEGVKDLISNFEGNMVIDADAINILSQNKDWLELLPPKRCVLTPHLKEFERITQPANNHYERLEQQRQFSLRYQCVVVLKGVYTSISTPQGFIYFNSNGNQGMAAGGSGDVLTGIILSLLAQGYMPNQAAQLGVFLHGAAADLALDKQSYESLLPSDIIENIGRAYKTLTN